MGRQADAVREMLDALGLINKAQYRAITEHLLVLAEALDERPTNSILLRQYPTVLRLTLSVADVDASDEDHQRLLELVRTPTRGSKSTGDEPHSGKRTTNPADGP
jgi:hypothetical protein